jgi:hypothetical protein
MLQRNGAFSSRHSVSIHNNSGKSSGNNILPILRPVPSPKTPHACRPNLVRQERNFRMRRQGRENHRQRRQISAETKTAATDRRNPRTNGLSGVDLEICGSEGLGGGRDRDRTCDPLDVNEVLSR